MASLFKNRIIYLKIAQVVILCKEDVQINIYISEKKALDNESAIN